MTKMLDFYFPHFQLGSQAEAARLPGSIRAQQTRALTGAGDDERKCLLFASGCYAKGRRGGGLLNPLLPLMRGRGWVAISLSSGQSP